MGRIRIRSDKLLLDFTYMGIRCREQTALADTLENHALLNKLLKEIENKIRLKRFIFSDQFPDSSRCPKFQTIDLQTRQRLALDETDFTSRIIQNTPKFKDFVYEWFAENKVLWKQSHVQNIRMIIKSYLLPAFADFPLTDIRREMIIKFRAELAIPKRNKNGKISNDRINHIMVPLRGVLNEAAARYHFPTPFVGIKHLKIEKTKIDPFSLDEINKFLKGIRSDFRDYYTVRFFTGMRTAEIDGLQWDCVDLKRREIIIEKTIVDGRIETPKTQSSYRAIKMSQPVYHSLTKQKLMTGKFKFVFCNSVGNPLDHRNITKRIWYPTLKFLGIKRRRPYQTRHTCATLWLASGESPEWIANQLGHSTTKMLFEVYSRYIPNNTRKDGSAFEKLLSTSI